MSRHNVNSIYNRYFSETGNDDERGIAVECGAVDGIFQSLTYDLYRTARWLTYNFEPNILMFNDLVINRIGDVNLNLALSNEIGEVNLFIPNESDKGYKNSNCSLDEEFVKNKNEEVYKGQPVKTITFDKFVQDYKIKKIDFMVLDVEGHEFEVLERFKHSAVIPRVLLLETAFLDGEKLSEMMDELSYVEDKGVNVGWENKLFVLK